MTKAPNKKWWEEIADVWDQEIGETGDIRHELVINPIVKDFLGDLNAYPLRDKEQKEIGRVVTNYFDEGLVIDKYEKFPHYHYTLSHYLNAFIASSLKLEQVTEPNNKLLLGNKMTEVVRNHTPMFISFKLKKS